MNTKAKGSRNERRSRDWYKSHGYSVIKSGASLGEFDLVAINIMNFVLIQVKTNGWPGTKEMERIKNFKCPVNCQKIIHRWDDGYTIPQIREVT